MIGLNTNTSALPPDYTATPTEVVITAVCTLCCGSGSNVTYTIGLVVGSMPLCPQCGGSGVMTVTFPIDPFLADLEHR